MPDSEDLLSRSILRPASPPDFPQDPPMRKDHSVSWKDMDAWECAVKAFRQGKPSPSLRKALAAFAASATPAALASEPEQSVIFSPASLWLALSMLARCAAGETRRQILHVLRISTVEALEEQTERLWRQLYTDSRFSSLILGNSLWLNGPLGDTCRSDTLRSLTEQFFADICAAPFGTEAADLAITAWIARQTRGLIGEDGPIVKTASEALAMLLSSLYYRAAWQTDFDPSDTKERIFTAADGSQQPAPFLRRTVSQTRFRKEKAWKASSLELDPGKMIFVLPKKGLPPESLLEDPAFLPALLRQKNPDTHLGEVRWSIPRFDLSSQLKLNDTIRSLGVTDLLDRERSDLTALTPSSAFLSQVSQMTRMKLHEGGIEASAVTIAECATLGLPPEDKELCIMNLNRPFLFVLEMESLPLFVGVVRTLAP